VASLQRLDQAAIETFAIPRLLLMDHAGYAIAWVTRLRHPDPGSGVVICCGTGYNGGDGLSTARHLLGWGYRVQVILAGSRAQLREEPAVFADIVQRFKTPCLEWTGAKVRAQARHWLDGCQVVIDALLGIGLTGPVREPMASLVQLINGAGKPVVSADIPSGLDGDTGEPHGEAVRAAVTVACGAPKQGYVNGQGPAYCGEVVVAPITIPMQARESA
jgi:NAD(P)H-hydrate epimerase